MKKIIDIVAAYGEAKKFGKKTALTTMVLAEGSAYGRAGARMLITESTGAEEIALSMLAAIKAILSNRKGYTLKYKADPIHTSEMELSISK
jgi:xanthine/CO dehydrogenase XdhC/CoxF family maturation factor